MATTLTVPSVRSRLADPSFRRLPVEEQLKGLAEVDASFGALPRIEQLKALVDPELSAMEAAPEGMEMPDPRVPLPAAPGPKLIPLEEGLAGFVTGQLQPAPELFPPEMGGPPPVVRPGVPIPPGLTAPAAGPPALQPPGVPFAADVIARSPETTKRFLTEGLAVLIPDVLGEIEALPEAEREAFIEDSGLAKLVAQAGARTILELLTAPTSLATMGALGVAAKGIKAAANAPRMVRLLRNMPKTRQFADVVSEVAVPAGVAGYAAPGIATQAVGATEAAVEGRPGEAAVRAAALAGGAAVAGVAGRHAIKRGQAVGARQPPAEVPAEPIPRAEVKAGRAKTAEFLRRGENLTASAWEDYLRVAGARPAPAGAAPIAEGVKLHTRSVRIEPAGEAATGRPGYRVVDEATGEVVVAGTGETVGNYLRTLGARPREGPPPVAEPELLTPKEAQQVVSETTRRARAKAEGRPAPPVAEPRTAQEIAEAEGGPRTYPEIVAEAEKPIRAPSPGAAAGAVRPQGGPPPLTVPLEQEPPKTKPQEIVSGPPPVQPAGITPSPIRPKGETDVPDLRRRAIEARTELERVKRDFAAASAEEEPDSQSYPDLFREVEGELQGPGADEPDWAVRVAERRLERAERRVAEAEPAGLLARQPGAEERGGPPPVAEAVQQETRPVQETVQRAVGPPGLEPAKPTEQLLDVELNFPLSSNAKRGLFEASADPIIAQIARNAGATRITLDSPHTFELSQEGGVTPDGTVRLNPNVADLPHTLLHELGEIIYERANQQERAQLHTLVENNLELIRKDSPGYAKMFEEGTKNEAVAQLFGLYKKLDERTKKSLASIVPSGSFESAFGKRTKVSPIPTQRPTGRRVQSWDEIKKTGGYLSEDDDLAAMAAKHGDRMVVLKDVNGGRHLLPATMAGKALVNPLVAGHVREVFLPDAKGITAPRIDNEILDYLPNMAKGFSQALPELAAQSPAIQRQLTEATRGGPPQLTEPEPTTKYQEPAGPAVETKAVAQAPAPALPLVTKPAEGVKLHKPAETPRAEIPAPFARKTAPKGSIARTSMEGEVEALGQQRDNLSKAIDTSTATLKTLRKNSKAFNRGIEERGKLQQRLDDVRQKLSTLRQRVAETQLEDTAEDASSPIAQRAARYRIAADRGERPDYETEREAIADLVEQEVGQRKLEQDDTELLTPEENQQAIEASVNAMSGRILDYPYRTAEELKSLTWELKKDRTEILRARVRKEYDEELSSYVSGTLRTIQEPIERHIRQGNIEEMTAALERARGIRAERQAEAKVTKEKVQQEVKARRPVLDQAIAKYKTFGEPDHQVDFLTTEEKEVAQYAIEAGEGNLPELAEKHPEIEPYRVEKMAIPKLTVGERKILDQANLETANNSGGLPRKAASDARDRLIQKGILASPGFNLTDYGKRVVANIMVENRANAEGRPMSEYSPGSAKIPAPEVSRYGTGFVVNTVEGKPAWSDGHVAFLGDPPPGPKAESKPDIERVWKAQDTKSPTVEPVGFVTNDRGVRLIAFSDGSAMNSTFYDYAVKTVPKATFKHADPQANFTVWSGDKMRGMVMPPMREDGWPKGIQALLEKHKPGRGKIAKQIREAARPDFAADLSGPEAEALRTAQELLREAIKDETGNLDLGKVISNLREWSEVAKLATTAAKGKRIGPTGIWNWANNTWHTPRYVGELHQPFMKYVDRAAAAYEEGDQLADQLLRILEPYFKLSDQDRKKLDGRLIDARFAHRNEIETAGLNERQLEAFRQVREAMQTALDWLADLVVDIASNGRLASAEELGSPQAVEEALTDVIEEEDQDKIPALAEKVWKILEEIRDAAAKGYVPFTRFGDYTYGVYPTQKALEDNPDLLPIHETRENALEAATRYQKITNTPRYKRLIDSGKYVARPPKFRLKAVKQELLHDLMGFEIHIFAKIAQAKPEFAKAYGLQPEELATLAESVQKMQQQFGFKAHFISAKLVPGFERDLARPFADYILGLTRHIAKAKMFRDFSRWMPSLGHNPMLQRYAKNYVKYLQSPAEEWGWVRGMMFHWALGVGNPMAAGVNLTQVMMMAAPWMLQYGGPQIIGPEILKAYRDVAKAMNAKELRLDYSKLPDDVREDAKQALEEGLLRAQATEQLYSLAARPGASKGLREKGKKVSTFLFSGSEHVNRLVSFIAMHRLWTAKKPDVKDIARTKKIFAKRTRKFGLPINYFGSAREFAEYGVRITQLEYGRYNRPQLFRGRVGALLGVFKMFAIGDLELALRLWKATYGGGAGGKGPAGAGVPRAHALRALLAYLMIGVLAHGIMGLHFAKTFSAIADKAWKLFSGGEEIDTELELHDQFKNMTTEEIGDFLAHGSSWLGAFDASMSLGRDDPFGLGRAIERGSWTEAFPVMATAGRLGEGAAGAIAGEGGRAGEAMVPRTVAGGMRAARLAKEGLRTRAGGQIIPRKEFTPTELVGTAASVPLKRVSKAYEEERRVALLRTGHRDIKSRLVHEAAKAIDAKDKEGTRKAFDEIKAYNKANRDKITAESIQEAVKLRRLPPKQRRVLSLPRGERRGYIKQQAGPPPVPKQAEPAMGGPPPL